ncbi:alpha/beta hydrolase [Bacillus sp. AK031]
MALLQVNFMSKSLMRTVPMNVILPVDKTAFPGMPAREDKPYKTLFLLHGMFGNYTDWVSETNIQRLAVEKDLVVIMPSGENMAYIDNPGANNNYGKFIGEELVEITRKMFPLSEKREDTYIAGLSMGGYGAIRNGLKYHETFGYIAGLSSGLITENIDKRPFDSEFLMNSRAYLEACFGDLSKVEESDKNPKWLIDRIVEQKSTIPKIYMACGNDDQLLGVNIDFTDYLEEKVSGLSLK